jgi:hypothetical protein
MGCGFEHVLEAGIVAQRIQVSICTGEAYQSFSARS